MADTLDQTLLSPDANAALPPRMRMSELGISGLKVLSNTIVEETDRAWRMPNRLATIDDMMKDEYIAAAIQFYTVMLSRVPFSIVPPKNATPTQKERANFVATCFEDMDDSMFSTMGSILSHMKYGFSALEIVLKRRTANTSRYEDGLVGIAALSPRAQATLGHWIYSEDGRKLLAVEQWLQNLQYGERYINLPTAQNGKITIPAEKLLLFTTSAQNNNPEGSPILKNAYKAFRYKKEIEKSELIGLARDLSGLVKMKAPAQYFSESASPAEKAIYEDLKRNLRNIARGEQEGVLIPSNLDPETKGTMFELELLTSTGAKSYDTSAIINRINGSIMIALFTDILNIGNNGAGSFAMVEGKKGLVEFGLEYRLQEIADVFNKRLIPMLFKYNQWDDKELPKLKFGKVSEIDLETLSKAGQRLGATGLIEADREMLNILRVSMGASPKADDEMPMEEFMNKPTTRAGDGMSEGMPNGTGNSNGSGGDTSVSNNENV